MLNDKRVVVIAGSSGIGLEAARQAARRGALVIITGRSSSRLRTAASAISLPVETVAFDATDRVQLEHFFNERSSIDHLVSCVGFTERGSLLDHEEAGARKVMEHKVLAQLSIVRLAVPRMARDGSITLTGGTSADRSIFPHFSAFSVVCNTALGALVKGLAGEIAPIRINVVEPTLTQTPFLGPITADVEALFARFIAKTPVGRIPQADEVARSYIHAMESGLLNGDRLRPDGGPSFSEW